MVVDAFRRTAFIDNLLNLINVYLQFLCKNLRTTEEKCLKFMNRKEWDVSLGDMDIRIVLLNSTYC